MAKWIVTGGVGFIGYHLSRAIAARGDDVVVIDDFSNAPYPTAAKRRNERDLLEEHGARARVVTACVTNREALRPHFADAAGVVHLAGLAGVRPSFKDPASYARVNVEGTAVTLALAHEARVQRYLFASSSSVYGNSTALPASEDAVAVEPESPYAASKRSAELVASAMCRVMPELPCTALRFFTVYGPRQRPEMAITLFMRAILANEPITVFGDGSMRRDFTYVDDIVAGILATMERAPCGFRAYNLGSESPIRLGALVDEIARTANRTPIIHYGATPAGDVTATFADVTRARTELGYSPKTTLSDGLAAVRDWVAAHPSDRE